MKDEKKSEFTIGNSTRREFLKTGAIATASTVALGMFDFKGFAQDSGKDDELKLISPTFEESPTYLATYPSSDRAKKICKDALVMDTLFSADGLPAHSDDETTSLSPKLRV